MRLVSFFKHLPLRLQIIILVVVVLALPLIAANIQITRDIDDQIHDQAGEKAEEISNIIVSSPVVINGLKNLDAISLQEIQEYTQTIKKIAGVEFIVVIDMKGIRVSHPDTAKIGKPMVGGDEVRVLNGQTYISSAQGSLGLSLRAFKPIFDDKHQQVGAVVVGIMSSSIDQAVARVNQPIMSALTLALLIGIVLAVILANSIKKILFGLEPVAIARLLGERNAILESVREGIIAIDRESRLTVVNSEAKRILGMAGIHGDIIGEKVDKSIPHTRLSEVLRSGELEFDREQDLNGITILTNRVPLYADGVIVGAIATFRDMSEVSKLAEELTGVNRYVEALRSSAHEFLNKLHVINGLARSDNRQVLAEYLADIINENQQELEFIDDAIKDPILAAFLTGKFSRARELGVDLFIDIDEVIPHISDPKVTHSLVTLLGNLIDNGLDAVQQAEIKELNIRFSLLNHMLEIEIDDTGPGMPVEKITQMFQRGYSTKGKNRGIGLFLVSAALDKLNGTMDVSSNPGDGMNFLIRIPLTVIKGSNDD